MLGANLSKIAGQGALFVFIQLGQKCNFYGHKIQVESLESFFLQHGLISRA